MSATKTLVVCKILVCIMSKKLSWSKQLDSFSVVYLYYYVYIHIYMDVYVIYIFFKMLYSQEKFWVSAISNDGLIILPII